MTALPAVHGRDRDSESVGEVLLRDGEWVDPVKERKRRKLVKDQWKGVNEKVSKMVHDALFPELKKKRPVKKVVAKKRAPRRK